MPFLQWLYRKAASGRDRKDPLAARLAELDDRLSRLESERAAAHPLLIQHADKVIIERVDLSSHLGTLEIDTLGGQLNIGVTSLGAARADELFPLVSTAPGPASSTSEGLSGKEAGATGATGPSPPRYHIRPRETKNRPPR